MTGPLSPQCVTSSEPRSLSGVSGTVTSTGFMVSPARDRSHGAGMLNVKRDGTGSSTECPSEAANSPPLPDPQPPVASSRASQASGEPSERDRLNPPPVTRSTDRTSVPVRRITLCSLASRRRHSITVCEESVTGNMRPSLSVFSFTPCASNQALVSAGPNRVNAPMSARSPRG